MEKLLARTLAIAFLSSERNAVSKSSALTLRALRQETMRKLNYSLPPRAIFRLVFSV
jgi:hypothetical protein